MIIGIAGVGKDTVAAAVVNMKDVPTTRRREEFVGNMEQQLRVMTDVPMLLREEYEYRYGATNQVYFKIVWCKHKWCI